MRSKRSRVAFLGVLALALSVTVGLTAGSADAKTKKVKTFSEQKTVGAAIPDDAAAGASVPVVSEITVPKKKYKKSLVGDVNVTNLQTSGAVADAADDLFAELTAPNGRTVLLFATVGDISLGPWTMDDDTKISICDSPTPPCENPNAQLNQPFAGTSNLLHNNDDVSTDGIAGPLSNFDGIKMKGTWTLTIWDEISGQTSTFNQWGLQIKPQKPPAVTE